MHEDGRTPSSRALRVSMWLIVTALASACETEIVSMVEVDDVEVVPPSFMLIAGRADTASAIVKESGGAELTGLDVVWTVDDPDVATVTSHGVVEGRSPGTTVVRASARGISGSAGVTVLRGPSIGFSTRLVDLEASTLDPPIGVEIEVDNAGNGTLGGLEASVASRNGSATTWLDAELLDVTAPTRLRLLVSSIDLDPGSYEAFVTVQSPDALSGPAEVRVLLRVVRGHDEPGPEEPIPGEPPGACDFRERVFTEDVEIAGNASCTFTNVRVEGRLQLRDGARLTASELTVQGNIEGNGAGEVVLADSWIRGDLRLENGVDITIGESSIDGKLELKTNQGVIALSDNIVGEVIKLEHNREGPFTLLLNTARNLECKDNDPAPTGAGNVISDKTTGQCNGL